ncbi:MAG: TonB-dependent receptor domain-containing protein, partial [Polyangia bacterium]
GDTFYGHRTFFIPPSDTSNALLQHVTSEDAARLVLGADFEREKFRLAIGAYGELVQRTIDEYTDYTLANRVLQQALLSGRYGAAALVDRAYRLRGLVGALSARLSVDSDGVRLHQIAFGNNSITNVSATQTYGELAIGSKARFRMFSFEAAIGVLLPFDNPSVTWPEAKLVIGYHPHRMIDVLLIGARKGRLPTLRELIDPLQGALSNPDPTKRSLDPEQTWHGELQLALRPSRFFAARLSGYVRRIDGLIRLDQTSGHDINLGTIDVRGLETGFELLRDRLIGGGGTYIFEDAYSAVPGLGFDAIPNFPRHRVDVFLSSTWRRRIGGLVRFDWVSERVVQQALLPRYYVMELDVWARIWRNLRGSVRIDNLTNNSYLLLPGLQALPTTVTVTVDGTWP